MAPPLVAPDDLVVRRYLDLSTAHLRQGTCANLNSFDRVIAHRHGHGWWMWVPPQDLDDDHPLDANDGQWPAELTPIVEAARAVGCCFINFDADADRSNHLEVFDW